MNLDGIIDFHMHTYMSDGVLGYAELVARAIEVGYTVMGITDHTDSGNFDIVTDSVLAFVEKTKSHYGNMISIIPGIELTHVCPSEITSLTSEARKKGIKLVIVHGETRTEPVMKGTNMAAINAKVDILAHPGFLTDEEAILAKKNNVYLEITSSRSHSIANGLVGKVAKNAGANMVVDSDFHQPGGFLSEKRIRDIVLGAALDESDLKQILDNNKSLAKKLLSKTNP